MLRTGLGAGSPVHGTDCCYHHSDFFRCYSCAIQLPHLVTRPVSNSQCLESRDMWSPCKSWPGSAISSLCLVRRCRVYRDVIGRYWGVVGTCSDSLCPEAGIGQGHMDSSKKKKKKSASQDANEPAMIRLLGAPRLHAQWTGTLRGRGCSSSHLWRVGFSSLSELFVSYASLNSLPSLQPHRCAVKQINKRINKISRIKSPAELNEESQLKVYDPKCCFKGVCFLL